MNPIEGAPAVGDEYVHYKGSRYKVVAVGFIEATREECVVYTDAYGGGQTWVRTLDNWRSKVDGMRRFIRVEPHRPRAGEDLECTVKLTIEFRAREVPNQLDVLHRINSALYGLLGSDLTMTSWLVQDVPKKEGVTDADHR